MRSNHGPANRVMRFPQLPSFTFFAGDQVFGRHSGLHEIHKPRFVNQTGPIELTRFEKTVNSWGFARGRSPLHVQNIITRRQRNAIVAVPVQRPMDES